MKDNNHVKSFSEFNENLNISGVMNSLTVDFTTDIINYFTTKEVSPNEVSEYIQKHKELSVGNTQFSNIDNLDIYKLTDMINYFTNSDISIGDTQNTMIDYFSNYS
jgi:dihydrodipicolinate reductase